MADRDLVESFGGQQADKEGDMEVELPVVERPKAVTVFGVLNIILGSMWFLGQLCGGALMRASQLRGEIDLPEEMLSPAQGAWWAVTSLVAAVVGLAFIIGGIGLLASRPWARKTCIGSAIVKLAMFVINQAVGVAMGVHMLSGDLASRMRGMDLPDLPAGVLLTVGLTAGCVLCFGLVLNVGYPVVLLVFMYLGSVKAYFQSLVARSETAMGPGTGEEEEKGSMT